MQTDMDDLIEAVEKIADTSFYVTNPLIAERRSGSAIKGFYRPGERSENGAPFEVTPTKCPTYKGPPSGRAPNDEDERGAWQLQEEYIAGRLGKNEEENSRNWITAKWIDKHNRIATMPAEATKGFNLITDSWDGNCNPEEIFGSRSEDEDIEAPFGREGVTINERDKEQLAIKIPDYVLVRLIDDFKECDKLAKIDVNKLARNADPTHVRVDLPSSIDRAESGKIIRMLKLGMRSLWHPVIQAIASHTDMKSLGEGKSKGVAAAVGRQRVIEGLRLAESIRKGTARQDRMNRTRAGQEVIPSVEWLRSDRFKLGSVDEIIRETLAVLPDKSLPIPQDNDCEASQWPARWASVVLPDIMKTAPVISMPMIQDFHPVKTKPLVDNDNFLADNAARNAA